MRFGKLAMWLGVLLLPATAHAAVSSAAPDGFSIEHTYAIEATPQAAWRALIEPARWWPSDHTWSGDAANLSLAAKAGACFCERWQAGEAEHARVVMATPETLLRLDGALGPLQAMAVNGVLTIDLAKDDANTKATVRYRVSGDSLHTLDKLAPVVDRVLDAQFGRWARFAATGKPEADDASASPKDAAAGRGR